MARRPHFGVTCDSDAVVNRFIKKLGSYVDLGEAEIASLEAATSRPREHAARHDLIREGDRPGPVFVMLEGWACRYKILPSGTRQILAYLMPGDACDLRLQRPRVHDRCEQGVPHLSYGHRVNRW